MDIDPFHFREGHARRYRQEHWAMIDELEDRLLKSLHARQPDERFITTSTDYNPFSDYYHVHALRHKWGPTPFGIYLCTTHLADVVHNCHPHARTSLINLIIYTEPIYEVLRDEIIAYTEEHKERLTTTLIPRYPPYKGAFEVFGRDA